MVGKVGTAVVDQIGVVGLQFDGVPPEKIIKKRRPQLTLGGFFSSLVNITDSNFNS